MGRIIRLGRFGADPDLVKGIVPLARELHALKRADREAALALMKPNTIAALRQLDYEWLLFARDEQLPPSTDNWRWWLMCGGRGGGKTRSAVECVIQWAWDNAGDRAAFVSKDVSGYRRIMLRGNSGILRRSPPWFKPRWWKTDKLLEWPNGTIAELHTSEEPDTLRGPEYHFAWLTELFHWTIPRGQNGPTAYESGIKFGLRLGAWPHGIIDSTPIPTPFCADFMYGPENDDGARAITQERIEAGAWSLQHEVEVDGAPHRYSVEVRRWDSEKNAANLAKGFVAELAKEYGTGITADLEMRGIINLRPQGTLFSWTDLESFAVQGIPRLRLVYVAVDPTRATAPVDECGIMVGGLGYDGHVYVWDDLTTKGAPKKYATQIVSAANANRADAVVLEKNRLPQKLRSLIRTTKSDLDINWIEVTASEDKLTRAEPVSKVVADGLIHFVLPRGSENAATRRDRTDKFRRLWTELVTWDPRRDRRSPSRMDSFVWLVTALLKLDAPSRKEIF